MRLIAKGDRGDEVADIQRRLVTLGYSVGPGGADGSFGSETEQAVQLFQRDHGLAGTGVVSDKTWQYLVEAGFTLGDRLLYLRTPFFRGGDVRRLQTWLNKLGFNTGVADGIFGQTTEKAVREFQRNIGLVADGIVGDNTLAAFSSLRITLGETSSRVFPDPNRTSALSGIVDRTVAIEAAGEIATEIASRFGNLLEILGAHVHDIKENRGDGQLLVAFQDGGSSEEPLTAYESDERFRASSRLLASSVQTELALSLGLKGGAATPVPIGKGLPGILVKPPVLVEPTEPVESEIYHQKFAVAVFDAVKSFLENVS